MYRAGAFGLLLAVVLLLAFSWVVAGAVRIAGTTRDVELLARHDRMNCERLASAVLRRDCRVALMRVLR